MNPAKRKKIKALLVNPATSENEKAICRKLLKANPEPQIDQQQKDKLWAVLNQAGMLGDRVHQVNTDHAARQRAALDRAAAAHRAGYSFDGFGGALGGMFGHPFKR